MSTRLPLARYLYDRALDVVQSGNAFSFGLAVSLVQDAVETMLNEVASAVGAAIPPNWTVDLHPKLTH